MGGGQFFGGGQFAGFGGAAEGDVKGAAHLGFGILAGVFFHARGEVVGLVQHDGAVQQIQRLHGGGGPAPAGAGGVDGRVLFWAPEGHGGGADDTFGGTESSIGMLGSRSTRWQARWDAVGRQCQHQKAWLVDAGTDAEVAFVGGINIGKSSMAGPDHAEPDPGPEVVGDDSYTDVHDVHCLVRGPAATDVHDNFEIGRAHV